MTYHFLQAVCESTALETFELEMNDEHREDQEQGIDKEFLFRSGKKNIKKQNNRTIATTKKLTNQLTN